MDREGFVPNPAGMERLLRSRPVQAATVRSAETIAGTARSIAPRDTGEYAGSFRTRPVQIPTLTRGGGKTIRAGAAVENTAPHALVVEGRNHVLARSARGIRT